MKELTIEGKAKRYDEALEKAKIWQEHLNESGDKDYAEELSYIFPKLKESEDEKIRKALIRFHKSTIKVDGIKGEEILAWLEKQGKKNLNDEVEPKFHEGEWVIYNNDICQIVKREEGCNILVTQFGVEKEPVNERNLSTAKLWDISDAKDGDMLAMSAGAFIYNGNNGGGSCPGCYCGINTLGNFKVGVEHHWTGKAVFPATKEQRDTLFAKMKEAGYIFDFEKKELKKIETEIEIPFGAKDSELQEAIYHIPKGFHAEIDDDKVVIKKGEKPTAWMEEDGKRIQRISDFIWKNRKGDTDDIYQQEQDVKWLKFLKGKVGCEANCTTTKEWSKEDEHRVKDTIYFLDTAKKHYASTVELDACIDWLKSLKQRIGG